MSAGQWLAVLAMAVAAIAAPAVATAQAYPQGAGAYPVGYIPCPNDAGVVGRTRARRFGAGWNSNRRPRGFVRAGIGFSALATQGMAVRGFGGATDFTALPAQQGVGVAWGASFDVSVGLFAFGSFYAAAELRLGGGNWGEFSTTLDSNVITLGGSRGYQTYAGLFSIGGVLPLGTFRARAELAAGLMDLEANADVLGGTYSGPTRGSAQRTLLEARVGLEAWLAPWVSAGLLVGMDVLHAPSVSASLYLQLHARPRDALPAAGE